MLIPLHLPRYGRTRQQHAQAQELYEEMRKLNPKGFRQPRKAVLEDIERQMKELRTGKKIPTRGDRKRMWRAITNKLIARERNMPTPARHLHPRHLRQRAA